MRTNSLLTNNVELLYNSYSRGFKQAAKQVLCIYYLTLRLSNNWGGWVKSLSTRGRPMWPSVVSASLPIAPNNCRVKALVGQHINWLCNRYGETLFMSNAERLYKIYSAKFMQTSCKAGTCITLLYDLEQFGGIGLRGWAPGGIQVAMCGFYKLTFRVKHLQSTSFAQLLCNSHIN